MKKKLVKREQLVKGISKLLLELTEAENPGSKKSTSPKKRMHSKKKKTKSSKRKKKAASRKPRRQNSKQNGKLSLRSLKNLPTLTQARKQLILEAMRRTKNNQTKAAELLGMSRQGLHRALSMMEE